MKGTTRREWVYAAAALSLGIALGVIIPEAGSSLASSAPAEVGQADVSLLRERVDELETRLALAEAERSVIAESMSAMERRMAALTIDSTHDSDRETAIARDRGPAGARAATRTEAPPGPTRREPRFDRQGLIDSGFEPGLVDAYSARLDELELRRLYLRDEAAREGWLDSQRYRNESTALFGELLGTREEFGDDLYDWTLYASGHPNRVQISAVMEDSPAAQAGLLPGDVVVTYEEQRILNGMELRQLTQAGEAGESTPIEVQREGETLRVFVPRGPLGVRIEPISQEPPSSEP